MRYKDKVAFITGGGSGMGEHTAYKLAEEGASVVIVGRTQNKLDRVVNKIISKGGEASGFLCDVSDSKSIENAIKETVKSMVA